MTQTKGSILIVDDDIDILETARMFLKQNFTYVEICPDPAKIPQLISRNSYDVVLLDMNFKKGKNDGEEGFYWLGRILDFDPDISVILITAYGEIDLAVRAIKMGAIDFILKPWKNQKLLGTVHAGWKLRRSNYEVQKLKNTQKHLEKEVRNTDTDIIGKSPSMGRVFDLVQKVADTDANVLLLGENGTGQALVARAIHNQSSRKKEPFIKADLGAVPETLFESELFGHVKGAFTDALENRMGSFELARGGTLFLDEIGNMALNLQAKLLTTLENRVIKKVGSDISQKIDIRLISATNKPIYNMVKEDKFRQDLLYRVNTVEITLPPLRERQEDIEMLVAHFLDIYTEKYKQERKPITPRLIQSLRKYAWPGNVRELQHVESTTEIPETLEEMERQFILKSLEKNDGNVTQTAKILGLTRTAMYRRLNKYGL
jgi:DNA-binding NtrC family response regulator